MKREIRSLLFSLLGLMLLQGSQAQITRTIKTGDTDAEATAKFSRVMRKGGVLKVQEGSWVITLQKKDKMRADVSIQGSNTRDEDSNHQGAWQGDHVKSTLTLRGTRLVIKDKASKLSITNLAWFGKGFETARFHQPELNLTNVLFDRKISNSTPRGRKFSLNLLDMRDGFSGSITYCSFLGFGARAIALNRTLPNNRWKRPSTSVAKLTIDRCEFVPHWRDESSIRALSHDAGNDEYPVIWNHGSKVISNSVFTDCGISASKGGNMTISGNTFNMIQGLVDVIHLEEYSKNITIKDNQVVMRGAFDENFLFVGAGNHGVNDITITGNTVDQDNGQLRFFASGKNGKNIRFSGNTVLRPEADVDYINFFGCGNEVFIAPSQPGLGTDNQKVNSTPCTPLIADGTYYIRWDDKFLANSGNNVRVLERTGLPKQQRFKWEIRHVRDVYYEIQNSRSTGNFLEVQRGAERGDQADLRKAGKSLAPLIHNDQQVSARGQDAYANQRAPLWAIFRNDNGKMTLVPGGNERLSQLRPGPPRD